VTAVRFRLEATFECLGCRFRWKGAPGPVDCPRCGGPRVRWVDFERWVSAGMVGRDLIS